MNKSVIIALGIIVVAGLWMAPAFFGNDDGDTSKTPNLQNKSDTKNAGAAAKSQVKIKSLKAQDYTQTVNLNGTTQASKRITLKAEASGRITEFLFDEGQAVKQGEVIVKLDLRDRKERVSEARKILAQRQTEYEAARSLENRGFNSRIKLAEATSNLETARANLKNAQDSLDKTTVIAPFDGILTNRMKEVGDYLNIGESLITLAQLDPIEIVGFVNENQIRYIEAGTKSTVFMRSKDIGQAMITYMSPLANPDTRTFQIKMTLPNPDMALVDGLTVEVSIPLKSREAYNISPSALTLGPDGRVGVKLVDENSHVIFRQVEVLSSLPTNIWVTGLPDQIKLVTLGQDFVSEGVEVEAVSDEIPK